MSRDNFHYANSLKSEHGVTYLHVLGSDHGSEQASKRIGIFPIDRHIGD